MRGQRLRRIVLCAELGFPLSWCASIGAWVVCRHVPLPVASDGGAFLRVKVSPVSPFTGER